MRLWDTPERAKRSEDVLVLLVALHTFAIGVALLVVPEWALRVGGWQSIPPLFFPRQAAVFHFVVGFGYLWELRQHRSIALLLFAKSAALVFLVTAALVWPAPWFVPFAGVADGLMAAAVWWLHRRTRPTPTP
jgi:hypothetical protein